MHFLSKLVAAAPDSFAALAASLQHFVAELLSAAPFRPAFIVVWQVAAAASAGAAAGAAGAGAAGVGAGVAGGGALCASAALTIQKEATTIAIVFIFGSVRCIP